MANRPAVYSSCTAQTCTVVPISSHSNKGPLFVRQLYHVFLLRISPRIFQKKNPNNVARLEPATFHITVRCYTATPYPLSIIKSYNNRKKSLKNHLKSCQNCLKSCQNCLKSYKILKKPLKMT